MAPSFFTSGSVEMLLSIRIRLTLMEGASFLRLCKIFLDRNAGMSMIRSQMMPLSKRQRINSVVMVSVFNLEGYVHTQHN